MKENDIGFRLQQVIDALGYRKLIDFINDIGINKSTFYGILNQGRSPTADTLLLLRKKGINVDWLISGEGDMFLNLSPELIRQKEFEGLSDEAKKALYKRKLLPMDRVRDIKGEINAEKFLKELPQRDQLGLIFNTVREWPPEELDRLIQILQALTK